MPVEIKGQQLRIRVKPPRHGAIFRIHDVGRKGRLHRVAMYSGGEWVTQGWRLNLSHYASASEALEDLRKIRDLPAGLRRRAERLVRDWFD